MGVVTGVESINKKASIFVGTPLLIEGFLAYKSPSSLALDTAWVRFPDSSLP